MTALLHFFFYFKMKHNRLNEILNYNKNSCYLHVRARFTTFQLQSQHINYKLIIFNLLAYLIYKHTSCTLRKHVTKNQTNFHDLNKLTFSGFDTNDHLSTGWLACGLLAVMIQQQDDHDPLLYFISLYVYTIFMVYISNWKNCKHAWTSAALPWHALVCTVYRLLSYHQIHGIDYHW